MSRVSAKMKRLRSRKRKNRTVDAKRYLGACYPVSKMRNFCGLATRWIFPWNRQLPLASTDQPQLVQYACGFNDKEKHIEPTKLSPDQKSAIIALAGPRLRRPSSLKMRTKKRRLARVHQNVRRFMPPLILKRALEDGATNFGTVKAEERAVIDAFYLAVSPLLPK